ncbi:MAG: MBL fold metallo-hydrolase [Desulfobacterales bacterium]|nr:MBL fold metallo-hydrolase [Desulfobacterales bacterium]
MRIDQPGPVNDRITLLGRNESCVYLLDGKDEYALLGGGMAYIVPDILKQVEDLGVPPEKIKKLVIHHSHFDHVGAVPYLKKTWPWMEVIASDRARELLSKEKVVAAISSLNMMLLPQEGVEDLKASLDITAIDVDQAVAQGDVVKCGDLDFEVIDVPGHSSCSMAVYIPALKALSASDAGGIPFGDRVFAAANSNFDAYQESLEKMAAYDTQIHLSEHYGALTGEDGQNYMGRSIQEAKSMRQLLESTYEKYRDEKKTVDAMVETICEQAPSNFLPREIMAMVLGQMTRFIAKQYA